MPSRLQQTIAEYRKQLLQRSRQAEAALEYAHEQAVKLIQPMLDILYQSIAAKLEADQEIPLEWLYENKRLQAIEQMITGQIDHFGALSQMQVGQLQSLAAQLGEQAGLAALDATVPSGVNWSFGVPSPKAIAALVGATQRGSPLYDLFQGFGNEAAQGASDALITGVTLGYNPRDIAPMVEQALDISRARALTIARTEGIRPYRQANMETFRANSDVVKGWTWICALLRNSCAACIAQHGTFHTLDEELNDHPNGACVAMPVTNDWSDILGPLGIDTTGLEDTSPDIVDGSDWFAGQSEAVQRSILGNSKYDAWSNGDFALSDIVGTSHSEDWGSSIYEKPLKELVK
jgi:F like protein